MWTQDQFEDRLIMMRDALVTQETSKKAEELEQATSEIFKPIEDEDIDTMDFDGLFAQGDRESEEIKRQDPMVKMQSMPVQ